MFSKTDLTDYAFAMYLRSKGAIDNFHHVGRSVQWRAGSSTVAIAIYDNVKCTRDIYI